MFVAYIYTYISKSGQSTDVLQSVNFIDHRRVIDNDHITEAQNSSCHYKYVMIYG